MFIDKATLARTHNPHGYKDKNGNLLSRLGGLNVGSTIYKTIGGKLIALKVTKLNPFCVNGN